MKAFGDRRWLAPEVIQTSAMDCGPASLRCLLEGFGISVSYGRLREACQTGVDGTSVDTLEELARQLGLDAEQVMLPADHLFVRGAEAVPALLVVRHPSGLSHFVVIWRRCGPFVMIMDPGTGRRWVKLRRLLAELFIHTTVVSAEGYREWAGSEDFLAVYRRRLELIGCSASAAPLLEAALGDPSWRPIATLDAATRQVAVLVSAGGLRAGPEAGALLRVLFERGSADPSQIPDVYWTVRAHPPEAGESRVALRGAILIRVRGRTTPSEDAAAARARLSPELRRALEEAPTQPGRTLWQWLARDALSSPLTVALALALAALATLIEALLFRSFLDAGRALGGQPERLVAMAAWIGFLLAQLTLEFAVTNALSRLGRTLEAWLRLGFARKLPRLSDRYFQSRPVSDMAERCHGIHGLRQLPELAGQALRSFFELLATSLAIVWLDPATAPVVLCLASGALAIPLSTQPALVERELRIRSHRGAMMRFFLDALLGLLPIRTHGAGRHVRREHEAMVTDWVSASRSLARVVLASEALSGLFMHALVVWLVLSHVRQAGAQGSALLLIYWALRLPALGAELATTLRQYPTHRNRTARLLEPLGASEESAPHTGSDASSSGSGLHVAFERVDVVANGQPILQRVDLSIAAGSHVAVVGASGAGKSSLVGLLLGWHEPVTGRIHVDGRELTRERLSDVRRVTAWVDPAVMLWNRSAYDNLRYGVRERHPALGPVLHAADLKGWLHAAPEGLQSLLGDGGGSLSGGEGQRLRFGRAWLRNDARLVILDEPFRGLDRETRRQLLATARAHWKGATLIHITHDIDETLDFERVLVIEGGRVREDADPRILAERPSRYASALAAERRARAELWGDRSWRRLRLEGGQLVPSETTQT